MMQSPCFFSAAVQAVAVCCARDGLECTYKKAGPSGHGREDRVEVSCPEMTTAVGKFDDVIFTN